MPDPTVALGTPPAARAASRREADATAEERRAAFARAEANMALEGMRPSGPRYERLRDAIVAGRMTPEEALAEISAAFGPDVE